MIARKAVRNPGVDRAAARNAGAPPARTPQPPALDSFLQLQHAVGNAAVARLIAQRRADTGAVIQRSPQAAFDNFSGGGSCSCGQDLGNNCAHYLSDAFIRAGYSELDGGKGAMYRKRKGRVVCEHGRPVRARELEKWFAAKAKKKSTKNTHSDTGTWAVWQGGGSYWGGHVAVHKHQGEEQPHEARGTNDFPEWPTQKHYTW